MQTDPPLRGRIGCFFGGGERTGACRYPATSILQQCSSTGGGVAPCRMACDFAVGSPPVRAEACGEHACLQNCGPPRAEAAGGCGPPMAVPSSCIEPVRPAAERRDLRRTLARSCPPPCCGCRPHVRFERGPKPAESTHSSDAGLRCGRLRPAAFACDACSDLRETKLRTTAQMRG